MAEFTVPVKRCSRCGQTKPLTDFGRNKTKHDGHQDWCKGCIARYYADNRERALDGMRRWRETHTEEKRDYAQRVHASNRATVFDHYGWTCRCCGSTEHLTIDHVNGDGTEHRAELGASATKMYRWIIQNNFPADLQTLCDPCNQSKRHGPRCRLDHRTA